MNEDTAVELYRKYRPKKFSDVVGQEAAVQTLTAMGKSGKVPGFIMFTGPSGCGKTTLARILKEKLKVAEIAFMEINAAKDRGIDFVRKIEQTLKYSPLEGKYKMYLVDEAHQLTGDAQGCLLKMLEDIEDYVKFIFCTTNPEKLRDTIKTRATVIELKAVGDEDLRGLVQSVAEKEGEKLDEELLDKLIACSDGSPRKALVYLSQVIGVKPSERAETLEQAYPERDAIELARALLDKRTNWATIAKILKGIEGLDEKAESIRWMVLSYMKKAAVGTPSKAKQAIDVISLFERNFYDSKAAGLVRCCYDAVSDGE